MAEDPIAQYTGLVAKYPNSELARFSLAKALFDNGQYSKAAEALQFCLQKKPDWMLAAILLGRSHLQLGDKTIAKQWLETAHELAVTQHHDGPLEEINNLLATL